VNRLMFCWNDGCLAGFFASHVLAFRQFLNSYYSFILYSPHCRRTVNKKKWISVTILARFSCSLMHNLFPFFFFFLSSLLALPPCPPNGTNVSCPVFVYRPSLDVLPYFGLHIYTCPYLSALHSKLFIGGLNWDTTDGTYSARCNLILTIADHMAARPCFD